MAPIYLEGKCLHFVTHKYRKVNNQLSRLILRTEPCQKVLICAGRLSTFILSNF